MNKLEVLILVSAGRTGVGASLGTDNCARFVHGHLLLLLGSLDLCHQN